MRSVGLSTLCDLVLTIAPSGSVAAEAVRGTVVDDVFSRPVAGASVLLLAEDGTVRRGTLTDSAGCYSLAAGAPGRYSLRIDADGYTSLVSPQFLIESDQNLAIELRIAHRSATQLTPVTVTGETAPLPTARCDTRRP